MFMKVTLINLGGPRNSEEIEQFLLDLFCDPLVFDLPLPEFLRIRLARFIARKRAPKVAHTYASMGFGGGSPLVDETNKQAKALEVCLQKKTGKDWKVQVAMACGYPNLRDLPKEDLIASKDNIILPLFPHFSRSTTMSIAKILEALTGQCPANIQDGSCGNHCGSNKKGGICPINRKGFIGQFHRYPEFLTATQNLILDYFKGKLKSEDFLHLDTKTGIPDWENITILFSAHGIPMRLIKKGDIYRKEIEENVKNLNELLIKSGFKGKTFLSFQSRVGPSKWTEPNTIDMLQHLGKEGYKRIAIFPISFVSDHLETLEEIGVQLKEIALASGVKEYYRIPAHGTYPEFINALASLVLK
ncbi:MAG: ferrochelatase [Leptospiraceae bacterium]|nr:ferrochelatase [Leptospiraceae bacterium]MBP9162175.1 ferrochelatase [Leptospiraceae bacterium]